MGGVIIIATAVALLGLIPLLVARRQAMTQTREGDRYSERLRLLDSDTRTSESCEDRSGGPILALKRTIPESNGGAMAAHVADRNGIRVDRRRARAVREIANLRARRAARLAAEAAAGRRRLVISGILALATLVAATVIWAASLAWAWVAIPAVLLVASLAASRLAAIRSEKVSTAELELLAELRAAVAGRPSPRAAKGAAEDPAPAAIAPVASAIDEVEADSESDEAVVPSSLDEAPEAGEAIEAPEVEVDPIGATASVERRTWGVASIPAPTYAMRGRVSGRSVHADTDLRGIPKVAARVPARPLRASVVGSNALSTEEVVADQAVALDLDAVLDARRAL